MSDDPVRKQAAPDRRDDDAFALKSRPEGVEAAVTRVLPVEEGTK
jgi:hypothetical protein